ncbi:WD40 repeat-like protein [Suillus decipiens]|nr:WD40 repeat-like protein [Suillus decipiens]
MKIKYSPQGDKFASIYRDDICVWSKDGELLIETQVDSWSVISLCWSKDGAYIFAPLTDHTIRKWQSIDGEELFVFQGHTSQIYSLCLSPNGCHLLSASYDYSVRIWDLETNQQVGDPLCHDNNVLAVAMSSDGQYFASAISGQDAKIYVWNLDAVLKHSREVGGDAEFSVKLKGHAVPTRDFSLASIRQSNTGDRARYVSPVLFFLNSCWPDAEIGK